MKVLVLGASGIVGQHMRLCVPAGVEPVWVRKTADPITRGCDLTDDDAVQALLEAAQPDVIVNLAGESSVDVVEREPNKFDAINVGLPEKMAVWCQNNGRRLLQTSSQAVFSGNSAPYYETDATDPINAYGVQKAAAEVEAHRHGQRVIRLTFILGIRPLPHVGRQNPLEAMLAGQSPQVSDRFFSPLMAWDAAEQIWDEVVSPTDAPIVQIGVPEPWTRYEISKLVNPRVNWCQNDYFPGIAPRPLDTTYARSRWNQGVESGIETAIEMAKRRAKIASSWRA